MTKTAVLYARISIATEKSVSVARQLAQARKTPPIADLDGATSAAFGEAAAAGGPGSTPTG
jgi:hypothetical protein